MSSDQTKNDNLHDKLSQLHLRDSQIIHTQAMEDFSTTHANEGHTQNSTVEEEARKWKWNGQLSKNGEILLATMKANHLIMQSVVKDNKTKIKAMGLDMQSLEDYNEKGPRKTWKANWRDSRICYHIDDMATRKYGVDASLIQPQEHQEIRRLAVTEAQASFRKPQPGASWRFEGKPQ